MADIKVRDLTDTSSVALDNQIMVLTNDEQNQVQNITVENLLTNVLSSDNGNVLEQGTDGKLYVETPENITGDLADLSTINKTSLVNAINEVDSDITDEATTRANADNNLQSQIDAITSASDVTDIVGTYAQLQAYDTTGLPDNSIIKVLQDESRQDETTYYRWVITGGVGAWVLIGEEGPYYTKSQADSLFATQQTTGNLASLDTSDKTSLVNAINELSSVLDPTQTADYINNSKAVESGAISSNSIILSNVIKYAHSSFDRSKFTVVGSPTITDDGIASGFSTSNYLKTPITMAQLKDKSWEVSTKWVNKGVLASANSDGDPLVTLGTADYVSLRSGISINELNSSKGIYFFCNCGNPDEETTTGQNSRANKSYAQSGMPDWAIATMKFDINSGTYYFYIEDSFNPTKTLIGTYIPSTVSKQLASVYNDSSSYISCGRDVARYVKNAIDLKQFSITVDGVEVFSGNKTGLDVIKPDDYEVVGSPTISADGVIVNTTSANGYIKTPVNLISGSSSLIEYYFRVKLNSISHSDNNEWGLLNGYGFRLFQGKDGYLQYRGGTPDAFIGPALSNSRYSEGETLDFYIAQTATSLYTKITNVDRNTVYESTNNNLTFTLNPSTSVQLLTFYSSNSYINQNCSMDLNYFKIYVDGNLVYQPCLKIPYTKGSEQYGGKYVNAQYLPRVKDAYEQGLANDYFTLDEVNGTYTLPMGNLYGMIENKVDKHNLVEVPAVIISTYQNGTSWYNLYSNGFCEQGGYHSTISTSNTWVKVSLLKTYKDKSYSAIAVNSGDSTNTAQVKVGNSSINDVDGFYICVSASSGAFWRTSGYLAEGEY